MATTVLTCSSSSAYLIFIIFFNFLLNNINGNINHQVHRRFEYKYSFKPPYLAQKDGSVPFWEYGGSECVEEIYI